MIIILLYYRETPVIVNLDALEYYLTESAELFVKSEMSTESFLSLPLDQTEQ